MSNTNDTNTNKDNNANNNGQEKGFFAKHGWKLAAGTAALGLAAGGAYYYMKNGGGSSSATADAGDVVSGIAKLFK